MPTTENHKFTKFVAEHISKQASDGPDFGSQATTRHEPTDCRVKNSVGVFVVPCGQRNQKIIIRNSSSGDLESAAFVSVC